MRTRQGGLVGAIVLVVLALMMVGLIATAAFNRAAGGGEDVETTMQRLGNAAQVLEQYAAAAQRLPCPADPAVDTGLEVQATAATCSFPEGTLPWRTIGLRRDDAFDAWGRKISYRVYTGNNGSLTQPGGVSMVECDTVETTPGGVTNVVANAGGLCKSYADPLLRDTTPAQFLAGKGLALTDNGVDHDDTAYVLISHGVTGLGAYSASGVRLDLPAGDERKNTSDTGRFWIKPFSDVDTAATSGTHFDDLLAYRTLPDLVKRIGLDARDWPEPPAPPPTSATFNSAWVTAAGGSTSSSDTGRDTLRTGGVEARGTNSGSNANIGYVVDSATGVAGLGVVGAFTPYLTNFGNEKLRFEFDDRFTFFGIALNNFSSYVLSGTTYVERVEFAFFRGGGSPVMTVTKSACSADNSKLETFSVNVGQEFDAVEVRPLAATNSGFTALLVSAVSGCSAAPCVPTISPAIACP